MQLGQNNPQDINNYINGHTIFGHNSAIFCSVELKIFIETQETIIYRLEMKNHDFYVKQKS